MDCVEDLGKFVKELSDRISELQDNTTQKPFSTWLLDLESICFTNPHNLLLAQSLLHALVSSYPQLYKLQGLYNLIIVSFTSLINYLTNQIGQMPRSLVN
jgi:hypothetical protein